MEYFANAKGMNFRGSKKREISPKELMGSSIKVLVDKRRLLHCHLENGALLSFKDSSFFYERRTC